MKAEKSTQAITDAELVLVLQSETATQREKDKAFNSLYSTHKRQVGFLFNSRVKDSDTAEDLLMITFEKAYEGIKQYDPKAAVFSTWLYKIAKNNLIDHFRKKNIEVLLIDSLGVNSQYDESMDFQIESNDFSPEQELVRDEVSSLINNAIGSIKNKSVRKIIIDRYINGLSFKEIASDLGVEDCSTLRTQIRRGKKELCHKLESLKVFSL
jgi:RNA polymerase sigma factor (sigma-70 family)